MRRDQGTQRDGEGARRRRFAVGPGPGPGPGGPPVVVVVRRGGCGADFWWGVEVLLVIVDVPLTTLIL